MRDWNAVGLYVLYVLLFAFAAAFPAAGAIAIYWLVRA